MLPHSSKVVWENQSNDVVFTESYQIQKEVPFSIP